MSSAKRLLKRLLHKRVQCQYGIVLFVSAARILVVEKPICEDEWLKKRSVTAGTGSSASNGKQPVLSLMPVNGSSNGDKSQLMLLSRMENQICSVC